MNYRILLLIGALMVATLAAACVTDTRAVEGDDCDIYPCSEECPPLGKYRITTTPSTITLPYGEEGTVDIDIRRLCAVDSQMTLYLTAVPSEGGYFTTSFSVDRLPVLGGTTRLTIKNIRPPFPGLPGSVQDINIQISPIAALEDNIRIKVIVPDESTSNPCSPWTRVTAVPTTDFSDLQFPRFSTTGYLTAGITPASDWLMKSTDAGRTWSLMPGTPNDPDGYMDRVFFVDESKGYVSFLGARNSTLYRTRNGGTTWEPVTSYTGGLIRSMNHTGIFYVVPRTGNQIWVSSDNGETWTQPVVHPDGNLNDIEFATTTQLVVARGAHGTGGISYSSDEGRTWQPSDAPDKTFLWVAFYDTENGVAGGEGVMALTSDGGMTWRQTGSFNSDRGSTQLYLQPGIGDKRLAYAASEHDIMETRDSGATWQRVCTATTPTVLFDAATLYNGAAVVISRSVMYRRDP
jgi:photosystem II stability/assembly factor-like uncharacterized protein